jgi:hypothetical protein
LFGAVVDLDRHARKDPRAVFLIQLIDPEPFALGIDTRRIEDLVRQSRNGHPKCEIDLLRVCIISVTCFLCHISVRFSISNATKRQSAGYPPGREKAVDTEWFHSYKNAPARLPADSSGVCRKQSEAFRPRRLHFVQRYE